jgi:hypothetical protein
MKRLIAAAVSLVALTTSAAHAATSPAQKPATHAAAHRQVARVCKPAPADEYFGKLKMSILGIRNTIKDQGLKVDYDPNAAPGTANAINLTEDAIHDWQHKYPCDSWLPGSLYALEHFYAKIHTDDGVRHVHAVFAWLHHDFPTNRVMYLAKRDNAEAVTTPVIANSALQQAQAITDRALAPTPEPTH